MPPLGISRQKSEEYCAQVLLGGVRVFGESQRAIDEAISRVSNWLVQHLTQHFSLSRTIIRTLIRRDVGDFLDDRILGAVLGRLLRFGMAYSVPVMSFRGSTYRIYMIEENAHLFRERASEVRATLRDTRIMSVKVVQQKYFPDGGWGTWSSADHLCARLVFNGAARYVDKFTIAWPRGLEHAGH